jgi:DedD protein
MAEEQQNVETLKRRGRRRLVGAVALVLAAVIVLPMVFDPEPRGTAPAVGVRVPAEDETPFTPKPPPAKKAEPVKKVEAEPVKQAEAVQKVEAQKKAAEQFVVQVGAFSNPQTAISKLQSAKLPHYTEPMPGNLTRVRAGPFATREAAEKALERLKGLGFQPGAVTMKSG